MNPIHQFEIHELFPIAKFGKYEIAFTNSAAYMLLVVVLLTIFFLGATARGSLVPSRLQSAAELSYEFVGKMIQSTAGTEGMKFFPFVFTLFMFVLTLNMISLIPHTFSVTSQMTNSIAGIKPSICCSCVSPNAEMIPVAASTVAAIMSES
jgi:F-type H+-transporting ATPase subunit a